MNTPKTLAALKKEFRENMPIKCTFRRGSDVIDVGNYYNTIGFGLMNGGFHAVLNCNQKNNNTLSTHLNKILEQIEQFALGLGAKYIRLSIKNESTIRFGKNDHHLHTFDKISDDADLETLFPILTSLSWFKSLDDTWKTSLLSFHTTITLFFKEKKQNDPTFMYEMLYHHTGFSGVSFYFEGFQGVAKTTFSHEGKHHLISPLGTMYLFENSDELYHHLNLLFSEIHKKQRLQNLYSPPRFHLERYISRILRNPTGLFDSIYGVCTQYTTPSRIEEVMMNNPTHRTISLYTEKIQIFSLDHTKIVVDEKGSRVLGYEDEHTFKEGLRDMIKDMTLRYFSSEFDDFSVNLSLVMTRFHHVQNGINLNEDWNACSVDPIVLEDVRLYQFMNLLVVGYGEQARTFSLDQTKDAFALFTERCVDHLLKQYTQNPI